MPKRSRIRTLVTDLNDALPWRVVEFIRRIPLLGRLYQRVTLACANYFTPYAQMKGLMRQLHKKRVREFVDG